MKNLKISAIALTIGLAFSVGAAAATISKAEYRMLGKNIDATYKVEKRKCDAFAGNAKDICSAEVKGKKNVAKADLEASYKPTVGTHYDARVAKVYADYAVAKEHCDDKAGNEKDVCVKEAQAAKIHATADAKAQLKSSKAIIMADEKIVDANVAAITKVIDARIDANADKRAADYAVANEKCDALAGDNKDKCKSEAKSSFGKR